MGHADTTARSHLYDPKATLRALLQPQMQMLDSVITAICIQAATKLFGQWAATVADDWDAARHRDAKSLVQEAVEALTRWSTNEELDVQERVRRRHSTGDTDR